MTAITRFPVGTVRIGGFISVDVEVSDGGDTVDGIFPEGSRQFEWQSGPPGHYVSTAPPEPHREIIPLDDGTGGSAAGNEAGPITWEAS